MYLKREKQVKPNLSKVFVSSPLLPAVSLAPVGLVAPLGPAISKERRVRVTVAEALDRRWHQEIKKAAREPDHKERIKDLTLLKIENLRGDLREGVIDRLEFIKELAAHLVVVAYPEPNSCYERKYPPTTDIDTANIRGLTRLLQEVRLTDDEKKEVERLIFYHVVTQTGGPLPPSFEMFTKGHGVIDFSKDLSRRISMRGLSLSYQDDDIIGEERDSPKHVFLQPGQRSCVSAAAAMIISDRLGRPISFQAVNLANNDTILEMISSNRLTPQEREVTTWVELQRNLIEYGPACMSCYTIGAHEIVVDSVELSEGGEPISVSIRDPYHGWAIAIKPSAFLRNLDSSQNEAVFRPIQLIHATAIGNRV